MFFQLLCQHLNRRTQERIKKETASSPFSFDPAQFFFSNILLRKLPLKTISSRVVKDTQKKLIFAHKQPHHAFRTYPHKKCHQAHQGQDTTLPPREWVQDGRVLKKKRDSLIKKPCENFVPSPGRAAQRRANRSMSWKGPTKRMGREQQQKNCISSSLFSPEDLLRVHICRLERRKNPIYFRVHR